jgi:DNA-binding Lrp family transcriptional regulator
MDDLDLRIIEILAKNSRVSFRKIAKETGLSTDTVMRRYKKLEEEGEIQPTIIVDYVKLGYEGLVYFIGGFHPKGNPSKVIEEVTKIPNVIAIMKASGSYDLVIVACMRSITHAFKIGEEIAAKSGNMVNIGIDLFLLALKGFDTIPPTDWHNLHTQTL